MTEPEAPGAAPAAAPSPEPAPAADRAATSEPGAPEAQPEPPLAYPWIHRDLQHLAKPVGQLKPHGRNARRHPKRNLDEIAASLKDHGQVSAAIVTTRPMILFGDTVSPAGTLLVGNGMYRAATEVLKWSHVAVLGFAGTEVEARKLALRDNRTSELAEWDYEPLGLELRELGELGVELDDIGWSPDEAAPLLEAEFNPGAPGGGAGGGGAGGSGGVGGSAKPGIHLTDAQRLVIDRACDDCRRRRNTPALTQAECLAIIAQDYLDAGTRASG